MHANVLLAWPMQKSMERVQDRRGQLQHLSIQLAEMSAKWPQTVWECVPSARMILYMDSLLQLVVSSNRLSFKSQPGQRDAGTADRRWDKLQMLWYFGQTPTDADSYVSLA